MSQNELPVPNNFSYYSLNPGVKRKTKSGSDNNKTIQQHQLDGATLIVDRINRQIKKYFHELMVYAEEVSSFHKMTKDELVSFAKREVKSANQLAK